MTFPIVQIRELVESQKSLHLSTINIDNSPLSSYAPFYYENGTFFVFLSRLASHYKNLARSSNVSIMIIEDEMKCSNIFARKRIEFQCTSVCKKTDCHETTAILDRFEQYSGETFSLLRTLSDFSLFEFKPKRGSFVEGFGQAYEINHHIISEIL